MDVACLEGSHSRGYTIGRGTVIGKVLRRMPNVQSNGDSAILMA
jgi:hypothetical protein